MFKRILVPLDGSARAEAALPVAAHLARAMGSTLILFSVYQVVPSEFVLSDYDREAAGAMAYLARVSDRAELVGIPVKTATLAGATVLSILDAVQEHQADLIVMVTHGRSGLLRWVLGSVAEKVTRHAPVSVLILNREEVITARPWLDSGRPLRVLVALDGSSFAEAALLPAAHLIEALAAPASGALHLIRVVKPPISGDDKVAPVMHQQEQSLQDARDYLRAVAERIRVGGFAEHPLQITWSSVAATDVAAALLDVAEGKKRTEGVETGENQEGVALIALATHWRRGVQRRTLGSIADRILEGTAMPLLIVHPPEEADKP